jgi:transposase
MSNPRENKRIEILALYRHTAKSQSETARYLDVNQSTVSRVIAKYEREGNVDLKYDNCGGSNRKFDDRDLRHIRNMVIKRPRSCARDIKQQLGPSGDNVSLRTVSRAMANAGCKALKPRQWPLITETQRQKRLAWAHKHRDWTENEWKRVVFSDETFLRVSDGSPQYVRLLDGHRLQRDHYISTVKHPVQVMVWGCFSYYGPGRCHVVQGTLDTDGYLSKIIDRRVVQQLEDWYPNNDGVFQQDNAPCHVSIRARRHFAGKRISLLDWPPSSPDINPIENLWSIVKRRMEVAQPRNKQDLISSFVHVWNRDKDLPEIMKKLVISMPTRVEKIIVNNGLGTGY